MAGFISSQDQWAMLEPAWHETFSRYQVPVLHTTDFHGTKGYFAKWARLKKRAFAEDIFAVSHGQLLGISLSVRKGDFVEHQRLTGELPNMSAYGVCFSGIMSKLVTDPRIAPAVKEKGVSFLVESGNKNNSEIEQFFHKMTKLDAFEGMLRSISFVGKESCRAIQVADFLAFHSRRKMREHDRFSGKIALPECYYLEVIKKHGPVWEFGALGAPKHVGIALKDHSNLDAVKALSLQRRNHH